jgi:RES domain-containing protein
VILWRISNHSSLDGAGGLRAPGRWHTRGSPIVYCAPNPAAALLEVLVHAEIDAGDIPVAFRYLEIEAPDDIELEPTDVRGIGPDWQKHISRTRRIGDEWLRSGLTALLRVPSVVVPATWNVLVNPRHPESRKLKIVQIHEHRLDERLAGF